MGCAIAPKICCRASTEVGARVLVEDWLQWSSLLHQSIAVDLVGDGADHGAGVPGVEGRAARGLDEQGLEVVALGVARGCC